ncbi:MAG: branched-chain amino acid transport system II carrier protein [Chlamydiia bacterium]|nr:branched-chain amino acid transport system II carrier protein [Chlamydiia bacterium]
MYSLAIFFAIRSPSRTLDILGYLLTPALLVSLGVLFGLAFWDAAPPSLSSTSANHLQSVFLGVSEGYNTMDFIAAIFFSISVIGLLKNVGEGPKNPVKTTLFASLIAMALLVIVYSGLILVSAQHSELLQGLPREELLSVVSQHLMGGHIAGLAGVIVGLACVSTSMALMVVYIEFLTKRCGFSQPLSAGLTFGVSWLMSITGVGGVTALTGPLLGICYPLLLGYAAVQMVRVGLNTCRMKKCQLKDKTAPLQSVD